MSKGKCRAWLALHNDSNESNVIVLSANFVVFARQQSKLKVSSRDLGLGQTSAVSNDVLFLVFYSAL